MLVRVMEIPSSDGNFRFGGGQLQQFKEVDWFRDDDNVLKADGSTDADLADWLKKKNYFDATKAYLVLSQRRCFTINYSAP